MNEQLQHYGILGMKWGIRRTPEQLGHKPSSNKYVPHNIKSGTKLYRVTAGNGDVKGNTYFTMLPPDRDMYRGSYSKVISKQQGGNGSANESTYSTNKDLKIANRKDIIDEFARVTGDEKVMTTMLKDYSNTLAAKNVRLGRIDESKEKEMGKNYADWYIKNFGNMAIHDQFVIMSRGMTVSTPIFRENVIQSLKKKGFDGYIDEAGVGGMASPREGVEPLVIFNAESVVKKEKTVPITESSIKAADIEYQKWFKKANSRGVVRNPW